MYQLNIWQKLLIDTPYGKQAEFLDRCLVPQSEVMVGYGYACGGSTALCVAALNGIDQEGHSSLFVRKAFRALGFPESPYMRLQGCSDLRGLLHKKHLREFHLDGGGYLELDHLLTTRDRHRYRGKQYDFIAIDCLEQFDLGDYEFLKSLLRPQGTIACAAHVADTKWAQWIPSYFTEKLVHATIDDNQSIDRGEILRSLNSVSPSRRYWMLSGSWQAVKELHRS